MLKKWFAALLCLMMLCPCLNALAATGDVMILEENAEDPGRYASSVIDTASDGQTLYVLRDGEIDVLKAGEKELTPYITGLTTNRNYYNLVEPDMDHCVGEIFLRDGMLWCLDKNWGSVFTLAAGENGAPVYGEVLELEINEEARVDEGMYRYLDFQFETCVMEGNTLYVLGYDYTAAEAEALFAFDLTTGAATVITDLGDMFALGGYKEGKLLLVAGKSEDFFDRETGDFLPWAVTVYDPADGNRTALGQVSSLRYYDARALLYDEGADMVYIVAGNMIYRMNSAGECELCAYHPFTDLYGEGDNAALLGGQVAVYGYGGGLCLRTCDPAQLPEETLSIANYYSNDMHKKAAAQMDDVAIFFTREGYFSTAQELGQALASGENQLDIIGVDLSWMDFSRLMDKGYCYDLSGSKTLTDFAADIYPMLSEPVTKDGRLYGVPVQMYGSYWRYNKEAFAELGLTPPTTYAELVDLINEFASEEHEDWWEEYTVLGDTEQIRMTLFYQAMSAYEQYMLSTGQPLTLDTPLFRELMGAIERLDAENIEIDPDTAWTEDGEPSEELEALWNKTALIETWGSLGLENGGDEYFSRFAPLELRVGEEATFVIPASVQVLMVNPRSSHIQTAVRYLENLVQAFPQETMTQFSPNYNDPIENKYYENNLKEMENYTSRMEKQVEAAEPIDKPDLQAQLDEYREYIEQYRETERYSAREEDIARYRALMEHVVLERPSVMYSQSNDDSFYTLRTRYADGQITLEQFISEGSGKLRLMQMENQ